MAINGPLFDVEKDLRRIDSGGRDAVAVAIALGWHARWTDSRQHLVVLRSPDGGDKQINVPTTNLNYNRAKSILRQVLSHTSRDAVVELIEGNTDVTHMDPTMVKARVMLSNTLKKDFQEWLDKEKAEAAAITEPAAPPVPEVAEDEEPQVIAAAPETIEEMLSLGTIKVLKRRPYLANKTGTAYESEFIDEVVFDNNLIAYGCKDCGFMSNRPRSVSGHAVHKHGSSANPNTRIATRPSILRGEPRPAPDPDVVSVREVTVRRDGFTLHAHLMAGGVDETVAVKASDAVLDLPHDERVALALAIIEGRELPAAREQITELTAQLDQAAAEIDRLRQERRVLRDLLSEEVS